MDNVIAVQQMTEAFRELGRRKPRSSAVDKPKLITLGGDHSLALPALRALKEIYERPIRVLHFDGESWPVPAPYLAIMIPLHVVMLVPSMGTFACFLVPLF